MKWQGSHTGAANYRLGLMAEETELGTLYYHLGYWGSAAYYLPEEKIAIAGFITQSQAFLAGLTKETLNQELSRILSEDIAFVLTQSGETPTVNLVC